MCSELALAFNILIYSSIYIFWSNNLAVCVCPFQPTQSKGLVFKLALSELRLANNVFLNTSYSFKLFFPAHHTAYVPRPARITNHNHQQLIYGNHLYQLLWCKDAPQRLFRLYVLYCIVLRKVWINIYVHIFMLSWRSARWMINFILAKRQFG